MRGGLIPGWSLAGRENGRKYSLLTAPCIIANASNTSSLDFRKSKPKHILFPLAHWPEATTGLHWTRRRPSRRLERPLLLHHAGEAPRGGRREGLSVEREGKVIDLSLFDLCHFGQLLPVYALNACCFEGSFVYLPWIFNGIVICFFVLS